MPADSPTFPSLKSPARIQQFLEESIRYNLESQGATCHSPRMVLRKRVAHCMEGALFAAAALRRIGHPPLLLDLEAVRDTDHVLAVYRQHGCWGSLAKSNYAGLGSRQPVYRTLRELALSYFDVYCNDAGEKTLRAFSTRPIDLHRFDAMDWENIEGDVWEIPSYLCEVTHTRLLTPQMERGLARMSTRLFDANYVGHQLPGGVSIRITPRPPRH